MDFYKRLALAGELIPYGKVATYGQLALLCGRPRNSRQVGRALSRELAGKKFPAYRVVNSQGFLSGASSFETPDMQKRLLQAEGVVVRDNRVDLKVWGWKNTMDDALFLCKSFEERGI
ncbi:MAG TPA: MGMT family protein [Candidatus Eisenbergiella merdavium]|uniref:MGMT family protein n=1 Tax=Candidatus Eisenbergiella merdavium TaxID=2838551 RepID=A0A9D2NGS3_9FIRM|nr:MGMT family protein [Candidatus Eisenbergiella merdavium]